MRSSGKGREAGLRLKPGGAGGHRDGFFDRRVGVPPAGGGKRRTSIPDPYEVKGAREGRGQRLDQEFGPGVHVPVFLLVCAE